MWRNGLRARLKIVWVYPMWVRIPPCPPNGTKADVANNTIIKIEAGRNQNPTLDTLKKIAKALDVSVDELIG